MDSVVEDLRGADAWNSSGNLLLKVAPGLLIVPAAMLGSLGMRLIDSTTGTLIMMAVLIVSTLFMFYFFRNPEIDRRGYVSLGDHDLVAPAEGTIWAIDSVPMDQVAADYGPLIQYGDMASPTSLKRTPELVTGKATRIVIILTIFDKHFQCMPATATLKRTIVKQGTFEPVMLLEKSALNERTVMEFQVNKADDVPSHNFYMVLIAGLIATQIELFPNCNPGDTLSRGAKISMIKFGSRVDLIIPREYEVTAKVGQSVKVGETVLAKLVGPVP